MGFEDRRYQIENYVAVKGMGISSIQAMDQESVIISNGERLPWHYIKPVELREDIMVQIGFGLIKKINNPFHIDVNMSISINGRFYFSRGIVYDDKSIWSFNGAGVKYLHQLQQMIWIIEPSFKFNLGS